MTNSPKPPFTVLIAEDNPGLARVLAFKFKSCGFHPLTCADGQEAWETFQSSDIDAVISDQEMPRLSGIDLCRQIRAVDSRLPLFLVTGRQLELASTNIADELGLEHVFGKPFSPTDVIKAVQQAIETRMQSEGPSGPQSSGHSEHSNEVSASQVASNSVTA